MSVGNAGQSDPDSDPAATRDHSPSKESSSPKSAQQGAAGKAKNPGDPAVARKSVAVLRQKADQAQSRDDPGTAFRLSVAAWDEARFYPNDPELSTATDELSAEIKSLSRRANEKHNASSKTMSVLVEK